MYAERRVELVTKIASVSTLRPEWIRDQLEALGFALSLCVHGKAYGRTLANAIRDHADGNITRQEADGFAFFALTTPEMRPVRDELSKVQRDRLYDFVSACIRADVIAAASTKATV